jgi:hypothetical protein
MIEQAGAVRAVIGLRQTIDVVFNIFFASLKVLCHLKTVVLNRVASPFALVKEANISVADLLSFTQSLIAYLCSIFSCIANVTRL